MAEEITDIDSGAKSEQEKLAEFVKESTEKNRQFFAIYLGLLVYVLLTVFSTTDQQLLVPSQGIKLPLVNVSLPLIGFYIVVPIFLLAIHFNLLQNLESHHYKLMRWRDVSPNKIVPREEIPPFLFDYERLEKGSLMEGFVRLSSRFLFLNSGPFALGILLWRFTDYQNIGITTWHLLVFTFDSYLVWLTGHAFQQNEQPIPNASSENVVKGFRAKLSLPSQSVVRIICHLVAYTSHLILTAWRRPFGFLVLSQFAIACWFHWSSNFGNEWQCMAGYDNCIAANRFTYIVGQTKQTFPILFSWFAPIISIDPNEDTWLPDKKNIEEIALMEGDNDTSHWWAKYGKGLNLSGRNLRGFSAPKAILPKLQLDINSVVDGADLSFAQLQGANFGYAHLQGANFVAANLQNSKIYSAQLQEANFSNALLQGADLNGSLLQGAILKSAKLQGASLIGSSLQGALLSEAQLQGVLLNNAQLQGADLSKANLQGTQLWLDEFQGANLTNTNFQGVTWISSELQGAIFNHTLFGGNKINLVQGESYKVIGVRLVKIPRKPLPIEVSFGSGEPFSPDLTDWDKLKRMADELPLFMHASYVNKLRDAMKQNSSKMQNLTEIFANKPDTVWKDLIPKWDTQQNMNLAARMAAARGLLKNYQNTFGEKSKDPHPEYLEKINLEFCNSQSFKSLGNNCTIFPSTR